MTKLSPPPLLPVIGYDNGVNYELPYSTKGQTLREAYPLCILASRVPISKGNQDLLLPRCTLAPPSGAGVSGGGFPTPVETADCKWPESTRESLAQELLQLRGGPLALGSTAPMLLKQGPAAARPSGPLASPGLTPSSAAWLAPLQADLGGGTDEHYGGVMRTAATSAEPPRPPQLIGMGRQHKHGLFVPFCWALLLLPYPPEGSQASTSDFAGADAVIKASAHVRQRPLDTFPPTHHARMGTVSPQEGSRRLSCGGLGFGKAMQTLKSIDVVCVWDLSQRTEAWSGVLMVHRTCSGSSQLCHLCQELTLWFSAENKHGRASHVVALSPAPPARITLAWGARWRAVTPGPKSPCCERCERRELASSCIRLLSEHSSPGPGTSGSAWVGEHVQAKATVMRVTCVSLLYFDRVLRAVPAWTLTSDPPLSGLTLGQSASSEFPDLQRSGTWKLYDPRAFALAIP
ncbi:hypothetical protein TREES_T100007479 [Tupaia chinensis]|uniref:Uncharacterized protein n=1 Tax=Tupaia chinensis TaxID=246437 RepID=L9L0S2_TUPCH|nr:hypothetical protein TREES_T100007479 [Tupaia chinensis]